MNTVKYFEVRDRSTNASVCCVDMSGEGRSKADHGVLARVGYSPQLRCILYTRLTNYHSKYHIDKYGRLHHKDDDDASDDRSRYDIYGWGDRTNATAHRYIHDNWDDLESGAVIDVQFILGESNVSKTSENTCETFA